MNDYLSVRGTRDFARVSPEELNRVQIARNGYHRKNRGTASQIGTMISRYLCDGLKSRCWDCECLVQCEYGDEELNSHTDDLLREAAGMGA